MSVTQVLEKVEGFSETELDELIAALQKKQHQSVEELQAAYYAEAQVFFNEPIILPEGTPTLRQMLEAKD